jgi:hypothetical protein
MVSLDEVQKVRHALSLIPICNKEYGHEIFCALPSRHAGECNFLSPQIEALGILDRWVTELTGNKSSKIPPIQDPGSGDHEWFQYKDDSFKSCRKCGVIKQTNGKNKKRCSGVTKLSVWR